MPTIVYQEKNGRKYAYSSESYWDKDKKAPRSRRRYLGVVDEKTGKIIEARRRNAEPAETEENPTAEQLKAAIESKDAEIAELNRRLDELTASYERLLETLSQIHSMADPEKY